MSENRCPHGNEIEFCVPCDLGEAKSSKENVSPDWQAGYAEGHADAMADLMGEIDRLRTGWQQFEQIAADHAREVLRLRAAISKCTGELGCEAYKLAGAADETSASAVRCINCGCDHMPAPRAAIFQCNCGTVWKMIDRRPVNGSEQ